MELLAPAGSLTNLYAAIESGADAIYLGGKAFNARASAANFTLEELEEGVRIAHLYGVAIYVTVNILIGDKELKELRQYIRDLDRIGVDAVIVQDLATARIVQEESSRLVIHGSTQMTATNLATVNYLYRMGFHRVVLGRELSLDEIIYITKHAKAEIEVFVHGALCVCYSGQCLMSSYIGGRSGNRGGCAQPCRLPYDLVDGKGDTLLPSGPAHLMSPKDLNYADHLTEMIQAGVHSFKVEGRMKQESYVRDVISSYRHVMDRAGVITKEEKRRLGDAFNRGFTQHYLTGTEGKSMITYETPAGKSNREAIPAEAMRRHIPLYAYVTGSLGEYLSLTYMTESGVSATVTSDYVLVEPKNAGTTEEQIFKQVSRLGGTPFELLSVQVPEGAYYIPVSVLNQLRRDAVVELEEALLAHYEEEIRVKPVPNQLAACAVERTVEPMVSVRCDEWENVKGAIRGGAKKIIFGGDRWQRRPYNLGIYKEIVDYVQSHGATITFAMPRIVREREVEGYKKDLQAMVEAAPDSIAISFLGGLEWLEELGYTGAVEGDSSLNMFNSEALQVLNDLGLTSVMLSEEATMEQLRGMAGNAPIPIEAMVDGQVELMVTEHCVISAFAGQGVKKDCPGVCLQKDYLLKDRRGDFFPLRTDPYCRMHILNCRLLDMKPYVKDLLQKGLSIFRLEARQGTEEEVASRVKMYVDLLAGRAEAPSKENQEVTRGHYFKGIF